MIRVLNWFERKVLNQRNRSWQIMGWGVQIQWLLLEDHPVQLSLIELTFPKASERPYDFPEFL
jgi:hypothetical protein